MEACESTIRKAEDWLQSVFYALGTNYAERFSGLGLILYYPRHVLPVLPLGSCPEAWCRSFSVSSGFPLVASFRLPRSRAA